MEMRLQRMTNVEKNGLENLKRQLQVLREPKNDKSELMDYDSSGDDSSLRLPAKKILPLSRYYYPTDIDV